jgi:hypothetical protein
VQISTPLTADEAGNVYFGFVAGSGAPSGLKSGIARVGVDKIGIWISAAAASGDPAMTEVQTNCAPAISYDRTTLYIAVSNGSAGGYAGYLLGLDRTTLVLKYKVRLKDPSIGDDAEINDDSTAAPTIGPSTTLADFMSGCVFGIPKREFA